MQEHYDTQKNFTWCFGGFNLFGGKLFPRRSEGPDSADCLASCLEKISFAVEFWGVIRILQLFVN